VSVRQRQRHIPSKIERLLQHVRRYRQIREINHRPRRRRRAAPQHPARAVKVRLDLRFLRHRSFPLPLLPIAHSPHCPFPLLPSRHPNLLPVSGSIIFHPCSLHIFPSTDHAKSSSCSVTIACETSSVPVGISTVYPGP